MGATVMDSIVIANKCLRFAASCAMHTLPSVPLVLASSSPLATVVSAGLAVEAARTLSLPSPLTAHSMSLLVSSYPPLTMTCPTA